MGSCFISYALAMTARYGKVLLLFRLDTISYCDDCEIALSSTHNDWTRLLNY